MDNLRGALLMVLAMLGFAVEDMFIKQMAAAIPVGQIIAVLGFGGALVFSLVLRRTEGRVWRADLFDRNILVRNALEMFGTVCFVTALARTDLTIASAILQATPLAVTLGAAMILKEAVGWRRWTAIAVGFAGVLLILRPGTDQFDANALWAMGGVIGLGGRDLITRTVPRTISSIRLATYAFAVLVPTGIFLMLVAGTPAVWPDPVNLTRLFVAVFLGMLAYFLIVAATRIGDLSVVSPFRYSRLVFALIIGALAFGETPDAATYLGAVLIVGSGLFTLWREARRPRASLAPKPLV